MQMFNIHFESGLVGGRGGGGGAIGNDIEGSSYRSAQPLLNS